jgi:hypothetical protein
MEVPCGQTCPHQEYREEPMIKATSGPGLIDVSLDHMFHAPPLVRLNRLEQANNVPYVDRFLLRKIRHGGARIILWISRTEVRRFTKINIPKTVTSI